ncbi:hypothetical protein ACIRU8_28240 [Streptomyces sp. NPDC101175]|uniref:hypothetical protein n=1 Tax=Streptomyces sp. NPDC101175 TaxID=3366123 RepID=UPI003834C79D
MNTVAPKVLTNEFNAWAKEQKLGDLRDVAEQMGMPDADKAARAHVTSFIASSFNPALDKDEINAKVAAAAAKKKAGPPAGVDNGLAPDEAVKALQSKLITSGASPSSASASSAPLSAPSQAGGLTKEAKEAAALSMGASPEQAKKLAEAPTPAPAAGSVPKAPVKPAPPGSFNAKVQALVANLQQVKATTQDVPARIDSDVVGSWSFGPGKAVNLGGTYAKSLHDAPDGSTWLFKADKDGGAIAHAESAASHALSLGGLPSVPVYVKKVEGKSGSVQPMLKDTHHFASGPKDWSQSEVDAIVRSHVGAWMVGDYDGHQANVLRTASGGLVRCDLGQAFKHYGQDKLALGYAPSGGGSYDPVHQKLYQAALSGGPRRRRQGQPRRGAPDHQELRGDPRLPVALHAALHRPPGRQGRRPLGTDDAQGGRQETRHPIGEGQQRADRRGLPGPRRAAEAEPAGVVRQLLRQGAEHADCGLPEARG